MVAKPELSTGSEDSLVGRLHRAVGGPAKLSTIDDPLAARKAVLAALAAQQPDARGAHRVARGDLTPLERRVVRTVTNRGAAVRSRARQRRELARLREELQRKDAQVRRLEAVLHDLSASMGAAQHPLPQLAYQEPFALSCGGEMNKPVASPELDQDLLGNMIDDLILPMSSHA